MCFESDRIVALIKKNERAMQNATYTIHAKKSIDNNQSNSLIPKWKNNSNETHSSASNEYEFSPFSIVVRSMALRHIEIESETCKLQHKVIAMNLMA